MGALFKAVGKHGFIRERGARADANARAVGPTRFIGTHLSGGDRPGRAGSWRERPLRWAS
jgi:hypothetical protein